MLDFYVSTLAGDLLEIADKMYNQFSGDYAWLEPYHTFWLTLYLDFLARFWTG